MSEETGSNQKEDEALVRARELLADGRLEECLSVLKTYWLNNPADPQAALLFSQLMSEAGRGELSTKLEKLSEKLINGSSEKQDATISGADDKGSPQELFEAGYGLIDIRQHELAAMLLNRAVNLLPDEPVINYELGFSLMSLGRFQKAIPYFEQAAKLQEDFDTCLNLAVCLTMTRRSQEARDLLKRLEKLAHSDEEKKELAHRAVVLRRLDTLKSKTQLSLRDWLYILYGSIMINPKPPAGREDYQSIAATLAVLKGVLEGLRTEIEAVEYYSPYSKPLAQILGELMELPMDSYKGPARPDRALLVMSWASDIIGPHEAFVPNQYQRCLFSYALTMKEPLPITPDIVGSFSEESTMPWTEAVRKGQNPETIVAQTLARARDLESEPEIIKQIQEAVDYYDAKRELLVLGNAASFAERPEYTAEIHEPPG